jgi:hypothetical protein
MKRPKKRPLNQFLKFSNIAIQMGVIIALGTYAGHSIDQYLQKDFPLFTLLLSLASVLGALLYIIKEVTRHSNDT